MSNRFDDRNDLSEADKELRWDKSIQEVAQEMILETNMMDGLSKIIE